MSESILCEVTEYDPDVLEPLIGLAVEIAREGRDGRSDVVGSSLFDSHRGQARIAVPTTRSNSSRLAPLAACTAIPWEMVTM